MDSNEAFARLLIQIDNKLTFILKYRGIWPEYRKQVLDRMGEQGEASGLEY